MPFIKGRKKLSYSDARELSTLKNGPRKAIVKVNQGVFRGNWQANQKSGLGTFLSFEKQSKYIGMWKNNSRHGYGMFTRRGKEPSFHLLYDGNWVNGKREGEGHQHYPDGSFYEGQWWNGKRHGEGRMWYADGSFYDGYWEDGKRHGLGLYVCENGNRYEGYWKNGKKHGLGHYYHLGTGQKQIGTWEEDSCITSEIIDTSFRQSACRPTPYPIKKLGVSKNIRSESSVMSNDNELVEEVTTEDTKEKVDAETNSLASLSENSEE